LIVGETQAADLNHDGLTDFIYVINYSSGRVAEVWQANGKQPDLLSKITSPLGAVTSIEYQRSAKYKDAAGNILNPELPLNFTTVKSISINDGNGIISTDNYSYEGGKYYYGGYLDRKPAGFHKIIKTDSQGNQFVSYFHQGDGSNGSTGEYADHSSKIGKSYRQDIFDAVGNKFTSTISKWENHNLGGNRELVNNTKVLTQNYNGDTTHKDKAETYSYDLNNGNLIQKN
jgi:sarcosine oxidase delta subunit